MRRPETLINPSSITKKIRKTVSPTNREYRHEANLTLYQFRRTLNEDLEDKVLEQSAKEVITIHRNKKNITI